MEALKLTLSRWVKAVIKETDQKSGGKCPAELKCIYGILMGRQKWSINDKICLAAVWASVRSFTKCCKLNIFVFQLFLLIRVTYRQLRISKNYLLTFIILIQCQCYASSYASISVIPSFHCSLEISFDSGPIDAFS